MDGRNGPDGQPLKFPMTAVGWHDLKLKTFIGNRGHTLRGQDHVRQRHQIVQRGDQRVTEITEKRIKRPNFVERLYAIFSVIDVHDHYRQGSLRLEEAWKTNTWWHRIFATVFGVILTDCYFAYKFHEEKHHRIVLEYHIFLGQLCKQLIFNPLLTARATRTHVENDDDLPMGLHGLKHLIDHPYYEDFRGTNKRARKRCVVCHNPTSYYCPECSIADMNGEYDVADLVCICDLKGDSICFQTHHGRK